MNSLFKILLPLLCSGSFFLGAQNYIWTEYNTLNSGIPDNSVHCILKGLNNDIWVGTDLGLTHFDGTTWTSYSTANSPLTDNSIRVLELDQLGQLWIGTTFGGIFIFDGATWQNITPANSDLPDYFIRHIKRDLTNDMWVGTVEGLARFNGTSWDIWTIANAGLNSNNITNIEVNSQNKKIIGTINGGLIYFENEVITEYTILEGGIPDNSAIDIAFDNSDNPWFASPSGGLYHDNGTQQWIGFNINNSTIPCNGLTSILHNSDDSFLLGSIENGLILFTPPNVFTNWTTLNSPLPDEQILCLERDANGEIWVGTRTAGLVKLTETTSIDENLDLQAINVYPNPFNEQIKINCSTGENLEISLVSAQGKLVYNMNHVLSTSATIEIPAEELQSGIYFLNIRSNSKTEIVRLIKK